MNSFSKWLPPYDIVPLISAVEAAQIITLAENSGSFKPPRIMNPDGLLEVKDLLPNVRHAHYFPNAPIYDLLAARLQAARAEVNRRYEFHLFPMQKQCIPYIYVMRYHADGERPAMRGHVDLTGHGTVDKRKLTVVIPLNSMASFSGGHLHVDVGVEYDAQSDAGVGDAIVFPSFAMHKVSTLECGVRYVAVAWLHGPRFR